MFRPFYGRNHTDKYDPSIFGPACCDSLGPMLSAPNDQPPCPKSSNRLLTKIGRSTPHGAAGSAPA